MCIYKVKGENQLNMMNIHRQKKLDGHKGHVLRRSQREELFTPWTGNSSQRDSNSGCGGAIGSCRLRLSALVTLQIHSPKGIFLSGHRDSPLYIQFLRVHSLSKFLLYTNYHEWGPRVIIIFTFLPPPSPLSLSHRGPSLSPSLPSSARRPRRGGAADGRRPRRAASACPSSLASPTAPARRRRGARVKASRPLIRVLVINDNGLWINDFI